MGVNSTELTEEYMMESMDSNEEDEDELVS